MAWFPLMRKAEILEMEVLRLRAALEKIRAKHPEIEETAVLDKAWFGRKVMARTGRVRYRVLPKEEKVPKVGRYRLVKV